MPENSVTTTFFADEKAAVAAIAKLEKKYDDLENKVRHLHKHHNEGAHESIEKIGEMSKAIGGMVLGFASVEGAIEKVFEATSEWRKEADAAALSIDKANRAFAIRTGTFGPQGKETLEKVREGANQAAISHRDAETLFGDLARHGFAGEALEKNFGQTAAGFAVNRTATGVDSNALANAVEKSMDRAAPKTAEALQKGMRDIFAMTRGTQMTADDVGALGETLETARGGRRAEVHAAALSRMGLKFEDVDLIGEDFATAMGRIKTGLEKVKPEERMAVLKELTGDAGMARRVMTGIGAMGANRAVFDQAVAEQTGGIAAGEVRGDNEAEEFAAKHGADFSVKLKAARKVNRDRGGVPFMNLMRSDAAQRLRGMGMSEDDAIGLAFGSVADTILPTGNKFGNVEGQREFLKEMRKQTLLLEATFQVQKEARDKIEEGNDNDRGKPRRGKNTDE